MRLGCAVLLTCSAARLQAQSQQLNALHVQALKPLKVAFRRPCHLACMLACGMTPRAWRSGRQAMLLYICLHTGQLHSFLDLMLMDSEDAELEECHKIGLSGLTHGCLLKLSGMQHCMCIGFRACSGAAGSSMPRKGPSDALNWANCVQHLPSFT